MRRVLQRGFSICWSSLICEYKWDKREEDGQAGKNSAIGEMWSEGSNNRSHRLYRKSLMQPIGIRSHMHLTRQGGGGLTFDCFYRKSTNDS